MEGKRAIHIISFLYYIKKKPGKAVKTVKEHGCNV
jgi:hypothetical protein